MLRNPQDSCGPNCSINMPFFDHDGIHFHYRESGSGMPFVFQHGLGADVNQTFELFTPPPAIRMITFDCRAHGETRPLGTEDGISIEQFTSDLVALLDHLQIRTAVVGGISMGAAIALRLALDHPHRVLGLVLSRPAWLDESRVDNMKVFSTLAEYIRKYGAWQGAQRYQETEAFQHVKRVSPDNANSLLSQFTHPRAEETVAKLERIPHYVPKHRREDWRRIKVPTLVIVNRQDEIHPFEFGDSLGREIPNARVVEVAPKSVSKERHMLEVQQALERYFAENASHWEAAENPART